MALNIPHGEHFTPDDYETAWLYNFVREALEEAERSGLNVNERRAAHLAVDVLDNRHTKMRDELVDTEKRLRMAESPDVSKFAHEFGVDFGTARRVLAAKAAEHDAARLHNASLAIFEQAFGVLERVTERLIDKLADTLVAATKPKPTITAERIALVAELVKSCGDLLPDAMRSRVADALDRLAAEAKAHAGN